MAAIATLGSLRITRALPYVNICRVGGDAWARRSEYRSEVGHALNIAESFFGEEITTRKVKFKLVRKIKVFVPREVLSCRCLVICEQGDARDHENLDGRARDLGARRPGWPS